MADPGLSIIAEAGVNHNGDVGMARELVHAASEAGADIVKFQSFRTEDLVSDTAVAAPYQERNTGKASQRELLKGLELDLEAFGELASECRKCNIEFLCTAFDSAMLPELIRLGMKSIKIASGEITNAPALAFAAKQNCPILLSTGMATLDEVGTALQVIENVAHVPVTILHCTSLYPAPLDSLNLKAIGTLQAAFDLPVGYSDHSLGEHAAIAAVALGATVIEKHFTLDTKLPGPDHSCSLEPSSFKSMVTHLRAVRGALGDGVKRPTPEELETAKVVRRSWHAKRALSAGYRIQGEDIALMRPNEGLAPGDSPVGRTLANARQTADPIRDQDLA
jgi:N,N'-diacetyllegionaminate synthase